MLERLQESARRSGGPWFELWLAFFPSIFTFFTPAVTVLLEYLDTEIFTLTLFLLYNSVA